MSESQATGTGTFRGSPQGNGKAEARPVNVLVVDDDVALRDLMERTLERAGFNVMTAREGGEGLQILLSHRFDVVVSDLMMEPMDGITFLSEARRIWPWMGVVVLSGFIQEELRRRAAAIGVHTILEKPVSFSTLVQEVRDEAMRMHERLEGHHGGVTLDHIQYQLSILRENTRTAIEAVSLEQALANLSRDLGQALPSVATAIMSRGDGDGRAIMVGTLRRSVSSGFLRQVEDLIRYRFKLLSGQEIVPDAALSVSGMDVSEDGIADLEQAFTFPIFNNGQVTGILVFVPPSDYAFSDADISFLYHAANHLTTVLMAFHRIRELAVRDELTGLYNRHHLQDELPGVWRMAARYGFSTGVMILDIDHFKQVNDNYGHLAGDAVLRELGQIARSVCRGSDLIARYGGDEIVVILPDADPGSLGRLTRRMIEAVRAHTFCADTNPLRCTVSIGAASSRSTDGKSMLDSEALLARADEALYVAKRSGRDRSHVWTGTPTPEPDPSHGDAMTDAPRSLATPRILVVDDDRSILNILQMLLEMEGFEAVLCETGDAAFEAVSSDPFRFQAALVDLNLNDMNGLDLIRKLGSLDAALVKIVITGEATLDNAINSLRHGAYDFIQKPIQRSQLQMTLGRALEYHRLRMENQEYQQNLEEMVRRKSVELTNALQRARDSLAFTLKAMAAMLDAREQATGAHSQRVQDITCLLARNFGMSERELADVRQGALLHDIGKIATPDAILLKEGPLNEDEWEVMRKHVKTGYELISQGPDLKGAAELMLCHHEAYDGTGYPNRLRGDRIPLGARIFSLVDAYDAMRSDRPYRRGMSSEDAVLEVRRHRGAQFDPAVVDVFLERLDEIETIGDWNARLEQG